MNKKCPILNGECIESKCMWWVEMVVKDITSGQISQANNCAMSKLPGLMIELLRNTNGVQAAVESSRNETVKRQEALLNIITIPRKVIEG